MRRSHSLSFFAPQLVKKVCSHNTTAVYGLLGSFKVKGVVARLKGWAPVLLVRLPLIQNQTSARIARPHLRFFKHVFLH